jgi:hypothetical protein
VAERNAPWIPKGESGPCAFCGSVFVAKRKPRKCCSKSCNAQYARLHRSYSRMSIEDRFWRYVPAGEPDACWEWQGYRDNYGYGKLNSPGHDGKILRASRVSYELNRGPIPDGLHILHSCDNPPCVNPAHLRPGTPADNTRDKMERGRHRNGGRYLHSDDVVRRVRRAVRDGGPIDEVAAAYGVKPRWVRSILYDGRRSDVA